MSKLTLLTKHIAGRDFCIHNLHSIIVDGKIVGYSFDLYFEGGGVNNYSTGMITGHELKEITDWLWRNV